MWAREKARELRNERASNWEKQKELQSKSKEGELSKEDNATWEKIEERQAAIEAELTKVEAEITAFDKRQTSLEGFRPNDVNDYDERNESTLDDSLEDWIRGGSGALDQDQRKQLRCGYRDKDLPAMLMGGGDFVTIRWGKTGTAAERRAERADKEHRAASTTTTAGGHMIAEDFGGVLIEALLSFGGARQMRSTVVTTSTGADLPFPTLDDTSNTGAILTENTEVAEQDMTFGQTILQAFKYTSKSVRVSIELLQDSAINVNELVARNLGTRIGRILNTHFTTGDASSKPNGFVTACASGKTAASATAFTYAELLDLKHSVDPAYRRNAEWTFNDTSLKAIKQLSVGASDARPLWAPSLIVGEPSTIDGDPYVINQDMASAASTTTPIVYGDMSYYYIRDVMDISILRLTEKWATFGQVGFLAFSRHDGDMLGGESTPAAFKKLTQAA